MKYLLVAPPKKGIRMFIESPCIGLGYLATSIRKMGNKVDIQDCIVNSWDNKKLISYIQDTKPDVLGINVFSTALKSVKELLGNLRFERWRPLIILGGPHCTGSPRHTLEYFTEADFAVRGEGEIPIMQFDDYSWGYRKIEEVAGLIWRSERGIKWNPQVEHPDLDDFGFPAWDLIDPPKYFKEKNVGNKSINIHFSRGCPYSCGFCVKLGTKVRWHSWQHIWKEIERLNAEYGVERFVINDEGFTMFPEKVEEFCRQAIAKGNRFTYFTATGLRLNRLTETMLSLMREAKFERSFGVGIESSVGRVREIMHKRLSQDELTSGLELLNDFGFRPVGNFILGYPGETKAEIKESINWACKSKLLWGANFVPFIPLAGSPIVNEMLETGELPEDYDFSEMNLAKVVYSPKGISLKELDGLRRWAVWKYNFRPKMLLHFLNPLLFGRAVVSFVRMFMPNWLLPKEWRRV